MFQAGRVLSQGVFQGSGKPSNSWQALCVCGGGWWCSQCSRLLKVKNTYIIDSVRGNKTPLLRLGQVLERGET